MRLDWLGTEALTWADFRAFCTRGSLESALGGELAGFVPGVRMSHVLQAIQVNEIRMLAYGLGGCKGPKPKLIDLMKSKSGDMRFKHKPDRLTVEEFNRRVGWD